jgi:hypothetical protein
MTIAPYRHVPRRPARLLVLLVFLVPVALAAPATVLADTGYEIDLYEREGYERQVDRRTCIAASTAMMLNFAAGRDLGLPQREILRFAQVRDALDDDRQRGSDQLGWAEAATHYSGHGRETWYRWRAFDTRRDALRAAAWTIAWSGRPVGLTVSHGRHAVVMTGFEATADPLEDRDWRLEAVYISDPLGPRHRRYAPVRTSPLNRYRETDATPDYDRAWYGKFVIVLPTW